MRALTRRAWVPGPGAPTTTVTGSDLHYPGSLTVDPELLEASDILEHERVAIVDVDNGQRFETYVIAGERHSGEIRVNGAAARLVHTGDIIVVFSYADFADDELEAHEPRVVHVDRANRIAAVDNRAATLIEGTPARADLGIRENPTIERRLEQRSA